MAYIGANPQISLQEYLTIDDISGDFDGVETSFALLVGGVAPVPGPKQSNQLLISLNGVIQEPDDTGSAGFRLSGGNIIFSSAPSAATPFFGVALAGADYVYAGTNFPDGSVTSPSITFANDLDSGFYRTGSGELAYTSNGTFRLKIDSSGRLGVGTSSPGTTLDVNGSAQITGSVSGFGGGELRLGPTTADTQSAISTQATGAPALIFDHRATSNTGSFIWRNGTGGGSTRMVLDGSGRLGVGTSSVQAPLHVLGAATVSSVGDVAAKLGRTGDSAVLIGSTDGNKPFIASEGAYPLYLRTNNQNALVIDSSQRVGIGTSTARAGFTVALGSSSIPAAGASTAAAVFSNAADDAAYGVNIGANTSGLGYIQTQRTDGTATTYDLAIQPNGGRVGIGVTPTELFHTGRTTHGVHALFYTADGTNNPRLAIYTSANGSHIQHTYSTVSEGLIFDIGGSVGSGTERARIDGGGRLLVGTPSSRLVYGGNTAGNIQSEGAGEGYNTTLSLTHNQGTGSNTFLRAPILSLSRTRGSAVGTNTVVQAEDVLGYIIFEGADGTNVERSAEIRAVVDGTPGANDMPGRLVFSTTPDGSSVPTERLRITKEGNIYFGNAISSTPWTKNSGNSTMSWIEDTGSNGGSLAIASNADRGFSGIYINKFNYTSGTGDDDRFADWRLNGGSAIGTITINATSNGVNYNTTSDYRLKENVVALTDGIDRLKQLNVNRFNFIGSTVVVDGFIAHEVQDVVPEAITGEKDAVDNEGNPKYQGIDQSKLVPLLTAALQEAIAKIEALETANASLEARLTALEGA